VAISLPAFVIFYSFLGLVAYWLIFQFARRGPEGHERMCACKPPW
jgi:cytochrome d ubiquinol oxidase subunit I